MMRVKVKEISIGFLLGLLFVLLGWVTIKAFCVSQFGFCDNPIIWTVIQKAKDSWNNNNYLVSATESAHAILMQTDCGFRIILSQPFYQQSNVLEAQGQLKNAIDLCRLGVRIIGRYDVEGAALYHCDD